MGKSRSTIALTRMKIDGEGFVRAISLSINEGASLDIILPQGEIL